MCPRARTCRGRRSCGRRRLIVESSTSTSCEAPALLWPWICSAASSVAPPSRVTPWNAKLLEPSSMTVAVNWMSRNERWSELVKLCARHRHRVARGRLDEHERGELAIRDRLLRVRPGVQDDAVARLGGRERAGERRRRAHVDHGRARGGRGRLRAGARVGHAAGIGAGAASVAPPAARRPCCPRGPAPAAPGPTSHPNPRPRRNRRGHRQHHQPSASRAGPPPSRPPLRSCSAHRTSRPLS